MRDLFSYSVNAALEHEQTGRRPIRIGELTCRTALSVSRLPGLNYALNPYEGCEHACVYCYAPYVLRTDPSEWGEWVNAKVNMPSILSRELKGKEGVVGVGTVTDPYQPIEARTSLTRMCLEQLLRSKLRVSILTKSDIVLRDLTLLAESSKVEVGMTVTARDDRIAAWFEPYAPPPSKRLRALTRMNSEGIETYVLMGPLIPIATEAELDKLISDIVETGTRRVMVDRLRLRPGMLDRVHNVGLLRDDESKRQFDAKALSHSYSSSLELRLQELVENAGMVFESAF
ncbi:MAG: radical SAM protein [Methanomassiliicoccales archaeon]|nr:radical SAM protein [Methanomassiliicoccales archaeon]